jgi:hypothetical protein
MIVSLLGTMARMISAKQNHNYKKMIGLACPCRPGAVDTAVDGNIERVGAGVAAIGRREYAYR